MHSVQQSDANVPVIGHWLTAPVTFATATPRCIERYRSNDALRQSSQGLIMQIENDTSSRRVTHLTWTLLCALISLLSACGGGHSSASSSSPSSSSSGGSSSSSSSSSGAGCPGGDCPPDVLLAGCSGNRIVSSGNGGNSVGSAATWIPIQATPINYTTGGTKWRLRHPEQRAHHVAGRDNRTDLSAGTRAWSGELQHRFFRAHRTVFGHRSRWTFPFL